ncbi:helix-turn-helix domain-containing protein [Nocardia sp. CNY236]|uniref:winged helix-turn-helix transcriptional regulator n=1 Tax=Nocardia sp. CNY236 TaxID=1169152 RepID=UPI0009DD2ABE|nr:helix-turn-helix domain-containing protein [Nocardia sp. CNY236]
MRSASDHSGATSRADDPSYASTLAAIDLLGQRWILRVVWELESGPRGFLQLRRSMGNCSSSMLADRLQRLQSAGLVDKHGPRGAYELTPAGTRLIASLQPLWDWSQTWTADRRHAPGPAADPPST